MISRLGDEAIPYRSIPKMCVKRSWSFAGSAINLREQTRSLSGGIMSEVISEATAPQTHVPQTPAPLPILSVIERRILGVLVEKAKTTPDAYPLSLNALVTGSNQKSNRDPVLNLTDLDVEEALGSVQQKGLTAKITGGRAERWRHNLYE